MLAEEVIHEDHIIEKKPLVSRRSYNYEFNSFKNIPYWDGEDLHAYKHNLNVYVPKQNGNHLLKEGKLPVVIFVHGGGWRRGDRNYWGDIYGKVGECFAKEGFVSVVISYRLAPEHKHPTHVQDVARSVRWVKENISKYEGDVDRVYIVGHSAGAHLTTLVSLDHRYLQEQGVDPTFIKGVVGLCGLYDLNLFAQGGTGWSSFAKGFIFRNMYIYSAFGNDAQVWTEASPVKYANKEAPPFLLLNAEMDFGFEEHAKLLEDALSSHGVPVQTGIINGTRHGSLIGMGFKQMGMGPPKEVLKPIISFLNDLANRL